MMRQRRWRGEEGVVTSAFKSVVVVVAVGDAAAFPLRRAAATDGPLWCGRKHCCGWGRNPLICPSVGRAADTTVTDAERGIYVEGPTGPATCLRRSSAKRQEFAVAPAAAALSRVRRPCA